MRSVKKQERKKSPDSKMLRSAFSLLELMLVVVIIGIVYAMALSSFKPSEKAELDSFSLTTLPQYLRKNFPLQEAKLVCFKPCGKCTLMVDGEWTGDEVDLFTSSDVTSYTLDKEGFASEEEFIPQDSKDAYRQACFILNKHVNDSISPIVLKFEDDFLCYKSGYEEVQSYASLAAIQGEYQKIVNIIRDEH